MGRQGGVNIAQQDITENFIGQINQMISNHS
jgi:hypothetical protein